MTTTPDMHAARTDRVARIRSEIRSGIYDADEQRLNAATDRLMHLLTREGGPLHGIIQPYGDVTIKPDAPPALSSLSGVDFERAEREIEEPCSECGGTGTVNEYDGNGYETNDRENWPGPCPKCNGERGHEEAEREAFDRDNVCDPYDGGRL